MKAQIKTPSRRVLVAIALLACAIPATLRATTNYFIPNAIGAWDTAGNWSSGLPPTNTDLVYITNGSSHVILTNATSSSWLTVSNLSVASSIWSSPGSGASLLINLSDPTKTFTVGSSANDGALLIGQTGTGLLTVSNSNLSASYATIGGPGAALGGAWNIFGGTNTLRGSMGGGGYALQIGYGATAYGSTMLIAGGGVLNAVGNTIGIGNGASALLTLSNGVVNAGTIRVGDTVGQPGSAGDYNIYGGTNNVTWAFFVGNNIAGRMMMNGGLVVFTNGLQPFVVGNTAVGSGQLTISNGELRVGSDMSLGAASGASGVVRMYGGTNTVNGFLKVGDAANATGSVTLAGGLLVTTNTTYVGNNGVGSVTTSNGTWLAGLVNVGTSNGSKGTLTLTGGTNVFSVSHASVGQGVGSVGTVLMNGGRLVTTNGSLYVGENGTGTMTVSNGTWLANKAYVAGGSVAGSLGTLTFAGGTSQFSTTLVAGAFLNSTGTINVTGGTLTVTNEDGGATTASLVVGRTGRGTLTLNGGTVTTDQLVVTNGVNSILSFGSGTLNARETLFNNGSAFIVGNGSSNAILSLLGGTSSYANGLTINTNATLLISNINTASSLGVVTNRGLFNIASGNYRPGAGSVSAGSGVLRVDSGGVLDLTNGSFTVGNTVTNLGAMRMFNGTVIYNQNVVNLGAYVSDPSTNTFNGNFTVGPTATVVAAAGDIYAFGSNFVMQSTNRAFDMSVAKVVFADTGYGLTTGTTNHSFDLSGSGAVDKGSNWLDHTQLATNFSIGTLTIASGNRLTLTGGVGTNALYVGVLDLSAWATNASALTNTLQAALSLDINLYYDKYDANNAYLQGVEFGLWGGGGLLIPIPEPSMAGLILGSTLLSVWLLRRKGGRD